MAEAGTTKLVILMADDDEADVYTAGRAFRRGSLEHEFHAVADGEELMDYLRRRGAYTAATAPRPDLLLLDLNMPRMGGMEALTELQRDEELRDIPVVVMTTSSEREDVARCYRLGANSVITKPATFDAMLDAVRLFDEYWFGLVHLPRRDPRRC